MNNDVLKTLYNTFRFLDLAGGIENAIYLDPKTSKETRDFIIKAKVERIKLIQNATKDIMAIE